MARMFKSTSEVTNGFNLVTVFEDGTESVKKYKTGDLVEDLRYIEDEEIKRVTGKVAAIEYTMNKPLKWNAKKPSDTIPVDMQLTNVLIDASSQYESNLVRVPLREVVEFDGQTNVKRMKYVPFIITDMEFKYSDYRVSNSSIEVGDTFNKVKIMDPNDLGNDVTGEFKVIGFAYTAPTTNEINVYGVAMTNTKTDETVVADLKYILEMNELYNYEIPDANAIKEVLENLAPGDTVVISNSVDTSGDNAITLDKDDVKVEMTNNIVCDGGKTSGIRVTAGSTELSGAGKVITTTPFDKDHGSGVISVTGDGDLTFNGSGIEAVIADDPVNKGQFGVCLYDNAKVTVNDGEFKAGWYCLSGNGSKTTKDSVTTINGGYFLSISDYALYHPHTGKLVINGGTIKGAAGALAANAGTIEINGGTFEVLGAGNTGDWADGTSGLADSCINLNAKYNDVTCTITGGTFTATTENSKMITVNTSKHKVNLSISGGKFTTKPEASWIAKGYSVTDEPDEDGFYVVSANK